MKSKTTRILTLSCMLALTAGVCTAGTPGSTRQLTSPDEVPDGLVKSDWAGIRAAYDAGRHAFQPTDSGWQARNPGQQWLTRFDGRGFVTEPDRGGWQWGLELKRYGFPGAERILSGAPTVKAEGQRLTYGWDSTVSEWFVNDRRGLEHGFTVRERPADAAESPLQFDLAVRGSLAARVAADGQGLLFCNAAGATVIHYSGLKVWDADGKTLAARFVTGAAGVRLLVREHGARYPLTIDPLAQQAYLKASNSDAGDQFGFSVAISGNTVLVGAPWEDSNATGVDGNQADNSATNSGAAYVFVRNGTTWSQQAYLKSTNSAAGDEFGFSVAVSGDTVVVGAPYATVNSLVQAGKAEVFVRSGTTWSHQAEFQTVPENLARFGFSVAVSGDAIMVGMPHDDTPSGGTDAGTVRVFDRDGETWAETETHTGIPASPQANFGWSIAMWDGTNAVVGARGHDGGRGHAFVLTKVGPPCATCWVVSTPLTHPSPTSADEFGFSVAGSGDTIVVGSPGRSIFGRAYVFERSGTTWTQQAKLTPNRPLPGGDFGHSVAVSGDTVVAGSRAFVFDGIDVFARSGTNWRRQAYFTVSDGTDDLVASLAMSGDTIIVGAPVEDSSATGVNGNQADNSATDSGAAYVFVPADFRITSIVRTNDNDLLVTWNTSGMSNTIQVTAGFSTNDFTDLTDIVVTTIWTNFWDVGALTNSPARYYRIRSP